MSYPSKKQNGPGFNDPEIEEQVFDSIHQFMPGEMLDYATVQEFSTGSIRNYLQKKKTNRYNNLGYFPELDSELSSD